MIPPPSPIRTFVLVFLAGWVLRGVLDWLRVRFHVGACAFCQSRFVCPRNCASFDPHIGLGTCPSCGHERHLFVARPQGPVQCWECRLEPDPEHGV
jgi:hypothetical protein